MTRKDKIEQYNTLRSRANCAVLTSVRVKLAQKAREIRLELLANPTQLEFQG